MSAAAKILKQLTVARVLYGVMALLAPSWLSRGTGVQLPDDARYFNALLGGRDLTVAGATLMALKAGREREALLLNASCEATDLVALLQELRQRGAVDTTTGAAMLFSSAGCFSIWRAARALKA